jgi:hypothetical protein
MAAAGPFSPLCCSRAPIWAAAAPRSAMSGGSSRWPVDGSRKSRADLEPAVGGGLVVVARTQGRRLLTRQRASGPHRGAMAAAGLLAASACRGGGGRAGLVGVLWWLRASGGVGRTQTRRQRTGLARRRSGRAVCLARSGGGQAPAKARFDVLARRRWRPRAPFISLEALLWCLSTPVSYRGASATLWWRSWR